MNLRNLRRLSRITQVELAKATGISRARLSLVECGYIDLTRDETSAIQRALVTDTKRRAAQIPIHAARLHEKH